MKLTIEINIPENLRYTHGVIGEQKERLLSELCNSENKEELISDIQHLHVAEEVMTVIVNEISRQEYPFIYEEKDMYSSPFCKIIAQSEQNENETEALIRLIDDFKEKLPETSFDRLNLDVSKGIIEENAKVKKKGKAKTEIEKLFHLYTKFQDRYKAKFGEEDALEEVYNIIRKEVERNAE